VKAGLEKERAALLVVIAGLVDGRKVVGAVAPGHRESRASWSEVLRDLRDRRRHPPKLVVGDGNLGIWGALRTVWPEADQQRCWNHKILNVLDKLPRTQRVAAKSMLSAIAYAPTQAQAAQKRREFEAWCHQHGDTKAADTLRRDWEQMLTFSRYPREHGVPLRPTNIVESPLAALRLRTDAAKRCKRVERATAVIWKMLTVAQQKVRRLNAPELLAKVYAGVEDKDGIEVTREGVAASCEFLHTS
jgi:transposase-like protein